MNFEIILALLCGFSIGWIAREIKAIHEELEFWQTLSSMPHRRPLSGPSASEGTSIDRLGGAGTPKD